LLYTISTISPFSAGHIIFSHILVSLFTSI
jgi:hypothetical protein